MFEWTRGFWVSLRRPCFLGIGAMKAATTWIWYQLQDHPQIQMPWQKELHYFDNLYCTPEHYLSNFRFATYGVKTGEITPAYLTVPHAPLMARVLCPDVKIFVVLRNPVERAFSHWKVAMWTEAKIPLGTSFREAFDFGHPHGPHWCSIKERGLYYKYLKRWYAAFPEKQIKIFWYEDLEQPERFLRELYSWLGVDEDFVPKGYKDKINENWSGRNPRFRLKDCQHVIDFYLPSILKLEEFTGRDLTRWKTPDLERRGSGLEKRGDK